MNRATRLRPQFVDFIPERLEEGVPYMSRRYHTASHLCCCGCRREVVTPLNPAKWQLSECNGVVTMTPSIGNWSFPCKSHYWIVANGVRWALALSAEHIVAVQARDRRDADLLTRVPGSRLAIIRRHAATICGSIISTISRWRRK
jgi:hypothetical protein